MTISTTIYICWTEPSLDIRFVRQVEADSARSKTVQSNDLNLHTKSNVSRGSVLINFFVMPEPLNNP